MEYNDTQLEIIEEIEKAFSDAFIEQMVKSEEEKIYRIKKRMEQNEY